MAAIAHREMYVGEYVLKYVFPTESGVAICCAGVEQADAAGWRAVLTRIGWSEG
jgi:hypothetical protein